MNRFAIPPGRAEEVDVTVRHTYRSLMKVYHFDMARGSMEIYHDIWHDYEKISKENGLQEKQEIEICITGIFVMGQTAYSKNIERVLDAYPCGVYNIHE